MKFFFSLGIIIAVFVPCNLSAQNNTDTTAKNDNVINDTTVYGKVEVEASFPGGDKAWRKYLERMLDNFNPAEHGAGNGKWTVIVQFVVDKEGNISNVKALTDFGYDMEETVVKMIKKGPKWIPATLNGQPVKAYRKQPVTFEIQGL